MGLFNFLNGKKKEKTKPVKKEPDPNELSDPGKPTADTAYQDHHRAAFLMIRQEIH